MLASFAGSTPAWAQSGPAVPAIFERRLQLPGLGDEIRRPSALHFDAAEGEILVGDGAHNRVVIFDSDGTYRYEFSGLDRFAMPLDLAVDSRGQIIVLGSTREGARMFRYDFDGLFLGPIAPDVAAEARITDIAIDENDRLFAVRPTSREILVLQDDAVVRRIPIGRDDEGNLEKDFDLGNIAARGGQLFLPVVAAATVRVIDVDSGEFLHSIGFRGENPGELIFPAAVSLPSAGLVAVLDRMRFTVVCYRSDGQFLGEFGGKGLRDGWFYHPHLLSPAGEDRLIIGQVFEDRVQICRIPDFILDGIDDGDRSRPQDASSELGQQLNPKRRRSQAR